MRMAVSLEDGLGLSGDRCMRDTPTVLANTDTEQIQTRSDSTIQTVRKTTTLTESVNWNINDVVIRF